MKQYAKGFSLLALLVMGCAALAQSLGTLSPAQRVVEGLDAVSPYKTGAVEFLFKHNRFPSSLAELGMGEFAGNDTVARIELTSADPSKEVTLRIVYGRWASSGNVLTLRGVKVEDGVKYECGGTGSTIVAEWLPAVCRSGNATNSH